VGRFPVAHIFIVAPSRAQLYRRAHCARSFIVVPSHAQLNHLGRRIPSPRHQFHLGRRIIAAPPSSWPAHHRGTANFISAGNGWRHLTPLASCPVGVALLVGGFTAPFATPKRSIILSSAPCSPS
jgi:hypothetical protein